MPVRMASEAWRSCWTSARAAGPVSQWGVAEVRSVGSGSEFAVDGECGFEGDEGAVVLDGKSEGVVEVTCALGEVTFRGGYADVDAGGAEAGDARVADLWVGVYGGDDAAGDAGGDERVGTGAGAAVVGAGFEGDVGGGAADVVAERGGLMEGGDFGVVEGVVEVCAFAEDARSRAMTQPTVGLGEARPTAVCASSSERDRRRCPAAGDTCSSSIDVGRGKAGDLGAGGEVFVDSHQGWLRWGGVLGRGGEGVCEEDGEESSEEVMHDVSSGAGP